MVNTPLEIGNFIINYLGLKKVKNIIQPNAWLKEARMGHDSSGFFGSLNGFLTSLTRIQNIPWEFKMEEKYSRKKSNKIAINFGL